MINMGNASYQKTNSPQELMQLIKTKKWYQIILYLKRNPEEASLWHTSTNVNASKNSNRNSFGSRSENVNKVVILERLLPLHFACELNAPVEVLSELLQCYPDAASLTDSPAGNLPLHYLVTCPYETNNITNTITASPYDNEVDDENISAQFNESPATKLQLLLSYNAGAASTKNKVLGKLPLHVAMESNLRLELMQLLIQEYEESVQVKDSEGKLPLHIACSCSSSVEAIELLCQYYPQAVDVSDYSNKRPIDYVSESFHPNKLAVIETLEQDLLHWELRRPPGKDADSPNNMRKAPSRSTPTELYKLIEKCKWDEILFKFKRFKSFGDEAAIRYTLADSRGTTWFTQLPLHLVFSNLANNLDTPTVKSNLAPPVTIFNCLLSSYPIALSSRDSNGNTPFHLAAEGLMKYLVFSGGDLKVLHYIKQVWALLVRSDYLPSTKSAAKSELARSIRNRYGMTFLHSALFGLQCNENRGLRESDSVWKSSVIDFVKVLISCSLSILNSKDQYKRTPHGLAKELQLDKDICNALYTSEGIDTAIIPRPTKNAKIDVIDNGSNPKENTVVRSLKQETASSDNGDTKILWPNISDSPVDSQENLHSLEQILSTESTEVEGWKPKKFPNRNSDTSSKMSSLLQGTKFSDGSSSKNQTSLTYSRSSKNSQSLIVEDPGDGDDEISIARTESSSSLNRNDDVVPAHKETIRSLEQTVAQMFPNTNFDADYVSDDDSFSRSESSSSDVPPKQKVSLPKSSDVTGILRQSKRPTTDVQKPKDNMSLDFLLDTLVQSNMQILSNLTEEDNKQINSSIPKEPDFVGKKIAVVQSKTRAPKQVEGYHEKPIEPQVDLTRSIMSLSTKSKKVEYQDDSMAEEMEGYYSQCGSLLLGSGSNSEFQDMLPESQILDHVPEQNEFTSIEPNREENVGIVGVAQRIEMDDRQTEGIGDEHYLDYFLSERDSDSVNFIDDVPVEPVTPRSSTNTVSMTTYETSLTSSFPLTEDTSISPQSSVKVVQDQVGSDTPVGIDDNEVRESDSISESLSFVNLSIKNMTIEQVPMPMAQKSEISLSNEQLSEPESLSRTLQDHVGTEVQIDTGNNAIAPLPHALNQPSDHISIVESSLEVVKSLEDFDQKKTTANRTESIVSLKDPTYDDLASPEIEPLRQTDEIETFEIPLNGKDKRCSKEYLPPLTQNGNTYTVNSPEITFNKYTARDSMYEEYYPEDHLSKNQLDENDDMLDFDFAEYSGPTFCNKSKPKYYDGSAEEEENRVQTPVSKALAEEGFREIPVNLDDLTGSPSVNNQFDPSFLDADENGFARFLAEGMNKPYLDRSEGTTKVNELPTLLDLNRLDTELESNLKILLGEGHWLLEHTFQDSSLSVTYIFKWLIGISLSIWLSFQLYSFTVFSSWSLIVTFPLPIYALIFPTSFSLESLCKREHRDHVESSKNASIFLPFLFDISNVWVQWFHTVRVKVSVYPILSTLRTCGEVRRNPFPPILTSGACTGNKVDGDNSSFEENLWSHKYSDEEAMMPFAMLKCMKGLLLIGVILNLILPIRNGLFESVFLFFLLTLICHLKNCFGDASRVLGMVGCHVGSEFISSSKEVFFVVIRYSSLFEGKYGVISALKRKAGFKGGTVTPPPPSITVAASPRSKISPGVPTNEI